MIVERLLFLFFMCIVIRCIKTIQNITQIEGHKLATAVLISLETLFFLLVFRDVIVGDITPPIVAAVVGGYIVGYYFGAFMEDRMALGKVIVTIKIAKKHSKELSKTLRKNGFIFIQSKRYYSHKGKLRKLHQGVIYRKELPKLKGVLKDFNIVATVEPIKTTFGKRIISSKDYVESQK